MQISELDAEDRAWLRTNAMRLYSGETIVTRGVVHEPEKLRGFVAREGRRRVGVALYHVAWPECELVFLEALERRRGIGTTLLRACEKAARHAGCSRFWLITTNDNLEALRFYQRRGLRLVRVHVGALAESRKLKPSIPLIGNHSIPLRDEIELDKVLTGS